MNILLCSERFIFRYGVDRVFISLGKELKKRGHSISILTNKFDKKVVDSFADKTITIPSPENYFNFEEYVYSWIHINFMDIFKDSMPDVIITSGWPFTSTIPFFNDLGIKVVFSDHGVVPIDGYTGNQLNVLKKSKLLRKKYLQKCSSIIAVSNFIANSQSKIDSHNKVPIFSILNGADHIDNHIWTTTEIDIGSTNNEIFKKIDQFREKNIKVILHLGRWEENCYKNSEASYELLRDLTKKNKNIILLVLSDGKNIKIPSDLSKYIHFIGFPNDPSLKKIMSSADLGISFSLWEGFNLPLAEMQWIGKPVICFNRGAHPEVIIDPWFLCKNIQDMSKKAYSVLFEDKNNIDNIQLSLYKEKFTWSKTTDKYCDIINNVLNNKIVKGDNKWPNINSVVVDVTCSSRDTANTGVARVSRRFGRELQAYCDVIFVIWDNEKKIYVLPTKEEYSRLGNYNGPICDNDSYLSLNGRKSLLDLFAEKNSIPPWLIFTEIFQEKDAIEIRQFAQKYGIQIASIFHDAIPISNPEYCNEKVKANHFNYMKELGKCEIVIPNSQFSTDCLKEFWTKNNIIPTKVETNLLPGEFAGNKRTNSPKQLSKKIKILCVSTLEPRKNHLNLIKACQYIEETKKDLDFGLTLVGNKYAGAMDLADKIIEISKKDKKIKYLGVISDEDLGKLYSEATFTVYPSIIEGFGIPIAESIWYGLPCICNQTGVMAEIAKDGGCLTTNVLDYKSLAESIYKMATSTTLYKNLSEQAISRPIKTWKDYTEKFISILNKNNNFDNFKRRLKNTGLESWQDKLYKNCSWENSEMNDSEKLAMKSILSTIAPTCCIEIDTNKNENLRTISNYSKAVFSINPPSIPTEKFSFLKNVSFLHGNSAILFPILLNELNSQNIPVDLIIINENNTTDTLTSYIKTILNYIPTKPLILIIRNSFNPEFRTAILDNDWTNCPYIHYFDLDFIPGSPVGKNGHAEGMMGGMALAYFLPIERPNELTITTSANTTFEAILSNIKHGHKKENNNLF